MMNEDQLTQLIRYAVNLFEQGFSREEVIEALEIKIPEGSPVEPEHIVLGAKGLLRQKRMTKKTWQEKHEENQ